MDAAEIARRAQAAREFTAEVGGRNFTLRLPTAHESAVAYVRNVPGGTADGAAWVLVQRYTLERAIVGWSGVKLADLLPNADEEDQPWAAALVPVLLDAHPQWERELSDGLLERMADRAKAMESDRKNS